MSGDFGTAIEMFDVSGILIEITAAFEKRGIVSTDVIIPAWTLFLFAIREQCPDEAKRGLFDKALRDCVSGLCGCEKKSGEEVYDIMSKIVKESGL